MSSEKATVNTRLLADLAMLHLSEEELCSLSSDMEKIIAFASQVSSASPKNETEPTADESRLREDTARISYNRETLLSLSPEKEDGFFKATRVVE